MKKNQVKTIKFPNRRLNFILTLTIVNLEKKKKKKKKSEHPGVVERIFNFTS
jgi:hypothetical protein